MRVSGREEGGRTVEANAAGATRRMPRAAVSEAVSPLSPADQVRVADEILAREYAYLKESSFHSDSLRDRFIQLYLVLAGSALSGAVALASKDQPLLPEVLAGLTGGLAWVGIGVLLMLIRLRRIAVECMQGMSRIKDSLRAPLGAAERRRVDDAILWDHGTVPRAPSWRGDSHKVHFLSAGIVVLLTALLVGAAAFYLQLAFLGEGATGRTVDVHPFLYRAAAVTALALVSLQHFYVRRLSAEMRSLEQDVAAARARRQAARPDAAADEALPPPMRPGP